MSSSDKPRLVGLTGGIGCGKTTVLKEFRRLGVPCFESDQVASAYYEEESFLKEVRNILGDTVFEEDGRINKRKVAAMVFSDKEKLSALNGLVHPRVRRDFAEWAAHQNCEYVIMESAILFEYGFDDMMDAVVCVYVDVQERIARLLDRDKTSVEEIKMRMKNQLTAEEKMERADWVVLNYEGNPRRRQVEYINQKLIQL